MVGFINNLAQIIIMTRGCVANRNHVARLKVVVTISTLCIGFSETCLCPTHHFVMHSGFKKTRTMSLGQKSRSQSALKLYALASVTPTNA